MRSNTQKLLVGTHVSAATHPLLVSLVELGAQSAKIKGKSGLRRRLAYDWDRVRAAFGACVLAGVKDEHVRAAMPFDGLFFNVDTGWHISAHDLLSYRFLVAAALRRVVPLCGSALKPFVIETVRDVIEARRQNGMDTLLQMRAHIESPLLPGRRFVMSSRLHGRLVYSLVQSDEFGRLKVLRHAHTLTFALRYHAKHLPKAAPVNR